MAHRDVRLEQLECFKVCVHFKQRVHPESDEGLGRLSGGHHRPLGKSPQLTSGVRLATPELGTARYLPSLGKDCITSRPSEARGTGRVPNSDTGRKIPLQRAGASQEVTRSHGLLDWLQT